MSEHNPNAWQDGFDAWQNGYDDVMFDGIDTSSEMPCKCVDCRLAYAAGSEAAFEELFGSSQSAQPNAHLTPETQATSQVVVNAETLEPSDSVPQSAQAQVA